MKIYHFAIIFIVFFMASVIKTDVSVGKLKAIENEKRRIASALSSAVSDAANCMSGTGGYGQNAVKRDEVVTVFFSSLYSSLGIVSDYAAQADMEWYIPVILICDTDGYYVYHYDEYRASDGGTYIERAWSEKLPYAYEDEHFIYRFTLTDMVYVYDKNNLLGTAPLIEANYKEFQVNPEYAAFRVNHKDCIMLDDEKYGLVRKDAIISELEEAMGYYTSRHNIIAAGHGITYSFSFPDNNQEEWAKYLGDLAIVVVFQGYPYGPGAYFTYNRIASAGAGTGRRTKYFLEQKSWYYLAHMQDCDRLHGNEMILDETFDSIEECARYGAYCCECIRHGARAPKLN